MYNGVPTSPTGAWVSSCLCAPFRASGPAWAGIQAGSPPIPRLVRCSAEPALSRKFLPDHKLQGGKRSCYFLGLAGRGFTGRQAQLDECRGW